MTTTVCRKRPLILEDFHQSQPSPSHVSKKLRRFSSPSLLDRLIAAFPNMDPQLLEKAVEECGNIDLESAIRKLNELCLGCQAAASTINETTPEIACPSRNLPVDGPGWVELLVEEMMKANSIDDARSRARTVLEGLEKSIRANIEATQKSSSDHDHNQEKIAMKEKIEGIVKENEILKRAVAIMHERQKEYDARAQEVEQMKQAVAEYQEKLRVLEVNNYALRMHLQQADQQCDSTIPNRFHPDVF